MRSFFAHETLRAHQLAVEVARWVAKARFPKGSSSLQDQALRASQSVALNIAEGRGRSGQARRHHYEIALGSAAEACAALDLVEIAGASEQQEHLRAVGSMLVGLMR